jgi:membrane-bound metal-dependent hydrolase YbcI (DUF457 family)
LDPITHGIAGALIGKGFFSEREGKVATFAAALGAVFPDVDFFAIVYAEMFSDDRLATIKLHRGFTHSFFGLPLFALVLAWLTRWYCRRRNWQAPSFWMLTLIYGVGIASHILFDSATSYGTRIWNPFSSERVAWDFVFIIDFVFTAIVLLPQVAAWVFSDREKGLVRGGSMWLLFNVSAAGVWWIARWFGFPFHAWILLIVAAVLAGIFLLPLAGDRGYAISRARWCRAGVYALVAYIVLCGVAHHFALERVREYAERNHLDVMLLGAIPSPPSFLEWSGKIRTRAGIYQARMDLRGKPPASFQFLADSPPDSFTAEALKLPDVQVYLWFARFPVMHSRAVGELHLVEFGDSRFSEPGQRMPAPFRFRLLFDSGGKLIEEDWAEGMAGFRVAKSRMPASETKP